MLVNYLYIVHHGKPHFARQTEFSLDRTKSISFDWTDFEKVFAEGEYVACM